MVRVYQTGRRQQVAHRALTDDTQKLCDRNAWAGGVEDRQEQRPGAVNIYRPQRVFEILLQRVRSGEDIWDGNCWGILL
jgi:hypothetical protein